METELLNGPGNRFDAQLTLRNVEFKALRDLAMTLLERVKALEARLPAEEKRKSKKDA